MNQSTFFNRLVVGLVAFSVVAGAWAMPRIGRGQGTGAQGASGPADLLETVPFDRITLVDGTVINVEPVSPRPLPTIDPKKERAKLKKQDEKNKPPEGGNITLPGEKPKSKTEDAKAEEEVPTQLTIHALEGDVRDFLVKRIDIKSVEYFEDMLLAEGERLMRSRQFPKAFEHYMIVQARDPRWKGLGEHVDRLLFEEGVDALRNSDDDRGLRLLGELHARQPDYPGLDDRLATAYGGRIRKAFDLDAFARGRQILHDLELITPNHDVVHVAKTRFTTKAKSLAEKAAKQTGGERLDLLTEALRVWPSLEGAADAYVEAFTAQPTLDVAVVDLPRPVAPWIRSPASERISRLIYQPILSADSEAALRGNVSDQLAASLDKAELGRRLDLRIRTGLAWSDGSRPVSSMDIIRALSDRTDPRSPCYNARWSDLLQKLVASDEEHVEIRLTRTFLKPEAWLSEPVGPAHAAWDGWVTTPKGRQPVGDGPFQWESATNEMTRYAAAPTASESLKVRRIREVRIANATLAVESFLRGDVTMLEHVPPDRALALAQNPEFKVGRYEQPSLHLIALDGRNPVLRNRSLRRGLSYAIDRKTLLEETLLKRASDEVNTVSDGPFARGTYADAPGVKPLGYDPLLAKMLIAAARREMGNKAIKLTFEYPAIPEAQAVVPKIAEALRKVDVEIETIERSESELEAALRSGRRFDMAYRASRCPDPVWEAGLLLCPGYDAPPSVDGLGALASPRILELLLRLERASEMPTATGLLVAIDRESRDELPVLPLWQLEDHYAWRTRLKGPGETATRFYQGIETWEIEPWFAKDPW